MGGPKVVAAEHADWFWKPRYPFCQVFHVRRGLHAVPEQEVAAKLVLSPKRRSVDCRSRAQSFKTRRKGVAPTVGECNAAVSAKGEVREVALEEMIGGEASDLFGVRLDGGEPRLGYGAEAVNVCA